MKGILLAGGTGSRLRPVTPVTSKQLCVVYDKPMIYYPLSTLIAAGVREVLIITTPRDQAAYFTLLGNGREFGVELKYRTQSSPNGIAKALELADPFTRRTPAALILGDNLFVPNGLRPITLTEPTRGAQIFTVPVDDPSSFGVAELDDEGTVKSLQEKPTEPRSNLAVPGLYLYDGTAADRARRTPSSSRGEYEISDVNQNYLDDGQLVARPLPAGTSWLDMGTFRDLNDAANLVRKLQQDTGTPVGSPHYAALMGGLLTQGEFEDVVHKYAKSEYGKLMAAQLP